MKTLLTQQDLRAIFDRKTEGMTNRQIAEAAGVNRNLIWNIKYGAPINGKLLEWIGYEKAESMYRKIKGGA